MDGRTTKQLHVRLMLSTRAKRLKTEILKEPQVPLVNQIFEGNFAVALLCVLCSQKTSKWNLNKTPFLQAAKGQIA